MKFHPDPAPPSLTDYQRNKLAHDRQVQRWIDRLVRCEEDDPAVDDPEINVGGLSDEKHLYIVDEVIKRRVLSDRERFTLGSWANKRVAPVMQPATIDTPWQDSEALFGLPVMQQFARDVLAACPGKRPGRPGGRTANWAGMLAMLWVLGVCRQKYVSEALDATKGQTRFLEMLAWAFGVEHIALPNASTISRLGPELAEIVIAQVHKTMALLYAVLDGFFPPDPLGQVRLTLDCTRVPAWVRQVGGGERWSHRDLLVRGSQPEAGFRAYIQQGAGVKREIDAATVVRGGYIYRDKVVAWRGYYLASICMSRYRGLPRSLTLGDASLNEPDHTVPLFSQSIAHEPHLMGALVATDAGFDIKDFIAGAQRNYAFDIVSRPRQGPLVKGKPSTAPFVLGDDDAISETIAKYTREGQAICRIHGRELDFRGFSKPDRDELGLAPGQEAPGGKFRVRWNSPEGCNFIEEAKCGQPSLRAEVNWRRFVRYPMYPAGAPEAYALRLANLGQLSYHEAFHKRLKQSGHAVGGTARTHITNKNVVEAVLQLAALAMVAAAVVDRTLRIGELLDQPSYANQQLLIPGMPKQLIVV